jgi:hypothetical protein
MNPQAHRERHSSLLLQAGIELAHGFHHPNPGPHRPLGIVLMGLGIAKVDQQPIAEILGNIPLKAGDHLGAGLLIGPYHLAPIFRVKLAGERSRIHQVAEQHGELTAFGFRNTRFFRSRHHVGWQVGLAARRS